MSDLKIYTKTIGVCYSWFDFADLSQRLYCLMTSNLKQLKIVDKVLLSNFSAFQSFKKSSNETRYVLPEVQHQESAV